MQHRPRVGDSYPRNRIFAAPLLSSTVISIVLPRTQHLPQALRTSNCQPPSATMHATALCTAVALLATCAFGAPAANSAPPFQVTSTNIQRVVGGNTSIEFTVYDPNKVAKATQVCNGTWVYGSRGFPSGSYVSSHCGNFAAELELTDVLQEPCGNSSFAWNMQSFDSIYSFVLGIEHEFENPAYFHVQTGTLTMTC